MPSRIFTGEKEKKERRRKKKGKNWNRVIFGDATVLSSGINIEIHVPSTDALNTIRSALLDEVN